MNNCSNIVFWWRLDLEVASELEESLFWKVQQLGINRFALFNIQENKSKKIFSVWLHCLEWNQHQRNILTASLLPLGKVFGVEIAKPVWSKVIEEDWSASWKKYWQPDPVGENLLIIPDWLDIPPKYASRNVIRLDPGSAFGTGSHPSTRLCLEYLEKCSPKDLRVGDLGCGSGILGLAALALGADQVVAVDIDSLAVSSTICNAKINNFQEEELVVSLGSVDVLAKQIKNELFDVLICNILAPVIEELAPGFEGLVKDDGRVVLSGLLIDQSSNLLASLETLGWFVCSMQDQGCWRLLEMARKRI